MVGREEGTMKAGDIVCVSGKGTLAVKGLSTTSATRSLKLMDSNGGTRFAVLDNGMLEIGKQTNAATQNTAVIKAAGADANIGLALMPKGNGAITAQVPDGTVTVNTAICYCLGISVIAHFFPHISTPLS